jgi:hypothetical protein
MALRRDFRNKTQHKNLIFDSESDEQLQGIFSKYGSLACNISVNETFYFLVDGGTW